MVVILFQFRFSHFHIFIFQECFASEWRRTAVTAAAWGIVEALSSVLRRTIPAGETVRNKRRRTRRTLKRRRKTISAYEFEIEENKNNIEMKKKNDPSR